MSVPDPWNPTPGTRREPSAPSEDILPPIDLSGTETRDEAVRAATRHAKAFGGRLHASTSVTDLGAAVARLGRIAVLVLVLAPVAACAAGDPPRADVPGLVAIPPGPYIAGSDRAEREMAYALDEAAYGHSRTRQWRWYENEPARGQRRTGAYRITRTPVTNAQYAAFVAATGHRAPDVDPETWASYRLVHSYERTRRHAWRDGRPPAGREDHPVVLISHGDAVAYAAWLSETTGQAWRLPSEAEWEKAVRGTDGRAFPWGDDWDPARANSHDQGPFDTLPVGEFPAGAGPFGLLDGAGQVFEWTATAGGQGRFVVKGGSWDDSGCGICRPAARHARPAEIKHILIGFRLVVE